MNYYKPSATVVAITSPVGETAHRIPYADLKSLVAYFARISNPRNKYNNKTAPKLVKFLREEGHWSPFDMVDIAVEVHTTRDIGRQMLRHYSMRFQEFSQRYAEVTDSLVMRECRLQDTTNRQNSLDCTDEALNLWWEASQINLQGLVERTYKTALEKGIAKEVARIILPEGMTMSTLFIKGSIRSWIHYLSARQHESTQKEHRMVAHALAEAMSEYWNFGEE